MGRVRKRNRIVHRLIYRSISNARASLYGLRTPLRHEERRANNTARGRHRQLLLDGGSLAESQKTLLQIEDIS